MNVDCSNNKGLTFAFMAMMMSATVALLAYSYQVFNVDTHVISSSSDDKATISVTGSGEVVAVPDIGRFSFSVVRRGDTPVDAQSETAEAHNSIISYIKDMGIEESDIKTTSYNLRPVYRWIEVPNKIGREQELQGYELNHRVEVLIRDIDKAGELLVRVGEQGATNISNLDFTIDDESAYKEEARGLAIDDAKNKAKILAEQLGVSLVRIIDYNEVSVGQPSYLRSASPMVVDSYASDVVSPDISFGENEITSQVIIQYEVR